MNVRGVEFRPARFCAPMAGLTHSALRRLIADFGGAGGLFTEMLCGRWLLREDLQRSPAVKRRPHEGPVIYQLMLGEPAHVPAILARLARLEPAGIDLNCACPAPKIRSVGAGSELFEDRARLAAILDALRRHHRGLLTVKIRLGRQQSGWEERLHDRLRLFGDCGVDAVIVHPRFAEDKLKRRARLELLPELKAASRLPLIASGDLHGPPAVRAHARHLSGVDGLMVGRMAVVQPWLFRAWDAPADGVAPDYAEVWTRLVAYVREDFPPPKLLPRVRAFTAYYARNFVFGHTLFTAAQAAPTLEALVERATRFFEAEPQPTRHPSVEGLA